MTENYKQILQDRLDDRNYERLMALPNPKLHRFVADAIKLCNPRSVFVVTDSREDIASLRRLAIEGGEEIPLATPGHTVHFDGYRDYLCNDQGRDKDNTKYLVPPRMHLGAKLNSADREEGLVEVRSLLKDSMAGRQMYVRFFSLGPTNSLFSISGVQITDSAYVCHSEDLLFRPTSSSSGSASRTTSSACSTPLASSTTASARTWTGSASTSTSRTSASTA